MGACEGGARAATRVGAVVSAACARAQEAHVRVGAWWYGTSTSAAIAWALALAALAGVLAWFFICSPYGAPAAPVYAEF